MIVWNRDNRTVTVTKSFKSEDTAVIVEDGNRSYLTDCIALMGNSIRELTIDKSIADYFFQSQVWLMIYPCVQIRGCVTIGDCGVKENGIRFYKFKTILL
jgi:hypothetical protein